VIRGQTLLQRARPAKPLNPRRDLEVIQVWTIAAAGTDEFIHVVVAAMDTAVHDASRLVSEDRQGAVAGLTGAWKRVSDVRPGTRPRVRAFTGAQCGDGRRAGTGHDVRGARTAHSTHRQA
jgi:hypothetical protein